MAIDFSPEASSIDFTPEEHTSQMPGYERYPLDALAGVAAAGQGIHNAPYNITNMFSQSAASHLPGAFQPTNIDFGQAFGIKDPGLIDKLIQGAGQYAPYALGGEAALASKIPSLLGRSALEGAAYGGTQSQNPAWGTVLGALGGLAGGAIGKVVGGIPGAISNYFSNNSLSKNAPVLLNEMANGITDRANAPLSLKDKIANLYKGNQAQAKQLAEPLNNANIRFDVADGKSSFPGYANAANELLAQRENLENLFDSNSSFGSKLNKEINAAQSFLSNKDKYGVDFQDIWGRLKDLGQMQAKASASGNRNEARLLGNLRSGLSDDLQTNLANTGNQELAKQLTTFNNFYKYKVAPIFENSIISKAAQIPRNVPVGSALAQALHKPSINSRLIFDQLDPATKDAAAYQLITGGKGTSEGMSTMTAQDIGKAYSKLNSDVKATIASHNPQADNAFQRLANIFGNKDSYQSLSQALLNKIPVVGQKLGSAYPLIANQQETALSQGLQGLFRNPLAPIAINHFGGNQ